MTSIIIFKNEKTYKTARNSSAVDLYIGPRYNEIVYKIAFSLYSSLFSIWYFEMGRSNKILTFFFKRTILFLIHHQFLQFWYQCIKKTSIYHNIGNFPPNCRRNPRKMDKICNFLQSADFGLDEIVDSVSFLCVAAAIWGEIAENAINENLLNLHWSS